MRVRFRNSMCVIAARQLSQIDGSETVVTVGDVGDIESKIRFTDLVIFRCEQHRQSGAGY